LEIKRGVREEMIMEEKEVDLRDYIRVIKKRKKTILLLFLIAVIASAVISFLLPPVYEVTLAMKIGDIIDVDTLEKELIESPTAASQFLEGPQILIEAVKELKLPYTLEEFRKKVSVEPVRETEDLVQIKVDVNDPGEAVNIGNYLANELLERHSEIKNLYESKETIIARYDEQIKQIDEELDEIDKNKEAIIAGYDEQIKDINEQLDEIDKNKEIILARYDENVQSMNNQLTLLGNEIDSSKKEKVRLGGAAEALSREIEKRMESPEALSDAEASVLVGRLGDIESRWESYSIDIAEKEQRYANLMEKLRETQLEKTEFEKTKNQRYDALSGELRRIGQESTKFQQTKEERYDTLSAELREAQLEKTKLQRIDSVEMYNTEILAAAEQPKVPVRPNKLLNILVAAVVGLIVGLGLAFSLEYFEKTD